MNDHERGLNVAAALGPTDPPEKLPPHTQKGYYVTEKEGIITVCGVGGPQIFDFQSLPFESVLFGPYPQRRLAWEAFRDWGEPLLLGYPDAVVLVPMQKPIPMRVWFEKVKIMPHFDFRKVGVETA